MIFVDPVVRVKIEDPLGEFGPIAPLAQRTVQSSVEIFGRKNGRDKLDELGARFDNSDASCEKEVARRDGGNAGLVFAPDSQVSLPCDTYMVDKIGGGGVPRDHPRGIPPRERGTNTAGPFDHRKKATARSSGPHLQEVISAGSNNVLVLEDGKGAIIKQPELVSFNGLEEQVFTFGSYKGASDDRRRCIIFVVEDSDVVGRP